MAKKSKTKNVWEKKLSQKPLIKHTFRGTDKDYQLGGWYESLTYDQRMEFYNALTNKLKDKEVDSASKWYKVNHSTDIDRENQVRTFLFSEIDKKKVKKDDLDLDSFLQPFLHTTNLRDDFTLEHIRKEKPVTNFGFGMKQGLAKLKAMVRREKPPEDCDYVHKHTCSGSEQDSSGDKAEDCGAKRPSRGVCNFAEWSSRSFPYRFGVPETEEDQELLRQHLSLEKHIFEKLKIVQDTKKLSLGHKLFSLKDTLRNIAEARPVKNSQFLNGMLQYIVQDADQTWQSYIVNLDEHLNIDANDLRKLMHVTVAAIRTAVDAVPMLLKAAKLATEVSLKAVLGIAQLLNYAGSWIHKYIRRKFSSDFDEQEMDWNTEIRNNQIKHIEDMCQSGLRKLGQKTSEVSEVVSKFMGRFNLINEGLRSKIMTFSDKPGQFTPLKAFIRGFLVTLTKLYDLVRAIPGIRQILIIPLEILIPNQFVPSPRECARRVISKLMCAKHVLSKIYDKDIVDDIIEHFDSKIRAYFNRFAGDSNEIEEDLGSLRRAKNYNEAYSALIREWNVNATKGSTERVSLAGGGGGGVAPASPLPEGGPSCTMLGLQHITVERLARMIADEEADSDGFPDQRRYEQLRDAIKRFYREHDTDNLPGTDRTVQNTVKSLVVNMKNAYTTATLDEDVAREVQRYFETPRRISRIPIRDYTPYGAYTGIVRIFQTLREMRAYEKRNLKRYTDDIQGVTIRRVYREDLSTDVYELCPGGCPLAAGEPRIQFRRDELVKVCAARAISRLVQQSGEVTVPKEQDAMAFSTTFTKADIHKQVDAVLDEGLSCPLQEGESVVPLNYNTLKNRVQGSLGTMTDEFWRLVCCAMSRIRSTLSHKNKVLYALNVFGSASLVVASAYTVHWLLPLVAGIGLMIAVYRMYKKNMDQAYKIAETYLDTVLMNLEVAEEADQGTRTRHGKTEYWLPNYKDNNTGVYARYSVIRKFAKMTNNLKDFPQKAIKVTGLKDATLKLTGTAATGAGATAAATAALGVASATGIGAAAAAGVGVAAGVHFEHILRNREYDMLQWVDKCKREKKYNHFYDKISKGWTKTGDGFKKMVARTFRVDTTFVIEKQIKLWALQCMVMEGVAEKQRLNIQAEMLANSPEQLVNTLFRHIREQTEYTTPPESIRALRRLDEGQAGTTHRTREGETDRTEYCIDGCDDERAGGGSVWATYGELEEIATQLNINMPENKKKNPFDRAVVLRSWFDNMCALSAQKTKADIIDRVRHVIEKSEKGNDPKTRKEFTQYELVWGKHRFVSRYSTLRVFAKAHAFFDDFPRERLPLGRLTALNKWWKGDEVAETYQQVQCLLYVPLFTPVQQSLFQPTTYPIPGLDKRLSIKEIYQTLKDHPTLLGGNMQTVTYKDDDLKELWNRPKKITSRKGLELLRKWWGTLQEHQREEVKMRIQDMPEAEILRRKAEILRRKYDTVDTSVDSQGKLPEDIQDFYENNDSTTLNNCKKSTEGYLIANMAGRIRVILQDNIVHILIIGDPNPDIAKLGDNDTPKVINKKLLEKYKKGVPIKKYQGLPTEITDQNHKHNLYVVSNIDPQKWYAEKTGQLSLRVSKDTTGSTPDQLFIDVTPKPNPSKLKHSGLCEYKPGDKYMVLQDKYKPCCGHEGPEEKVLKDEFRTLYPYPILDIEHQTCRNNHGGSSQYAYKAR